MQDQISRPTGTVRNRAESNPPRTARGRSLPALRFGGASLGSTTVTFFAILLLGTFARTWEWRSLPPGLNQDEASSGVDAFSLYHFGVDANGVSYPVHLISFGSGTSALYAYTLIPFIALGGLSPFTVRLPMLISGLLTLPLIYFIGKRVAGREYGLICMFLLAISPWHILLSRWGLDSNILPFVFALGFLLLLKSIADNRRFVPAMAVMALCLYAYGTAFAALPLFLLSGLPTLVLTKQLRGRILVAGLFVFIIMAAPIALFLLVNTFHWESVRLGPVTVPRIPITPRFETMGLFFHGDLLPNLIGHLRDLLRLLWLQLDDRILNGVPPYGYFYRLTFPLAVLGAALLIPFHGAGRQPERLLLVLWLVAGLILGVLQPANINRMNLAFLPMILCVGAVLVWLGQRSRIALWAAISVFVVSFLFFTLDYHSAAYRSAAARESFPGLLPAIDFASRNSSNRICVTDAVNEPYIFVLFSQKIDPAEYLPGIVYARQAYDIRKVILLNRYRFGLGHCPDDDSLVYVLSGETPPRADIPYRVVVFDGFKVYLPETASD